MSATASSHDPSPSVDAQNPEHAEHEDASVILPFLGILIAIAVPFGLAVAAGAGGGIAVTCLGVLAIAVMLLALTVVLGRVMSDSAH